ncbi:MAG: hypothetical protein IT431_15510 [Phycisphaerales bacterium]|nr:hypothetical protein [Phycisphaerales bacterium]
MALNMGQMVREERREYAQVFGMPTHSNHKEYLVRQIMWPVQASGEAGFRSWSGGGRSRFWTRVWQ